MLERREKLNHTLTAIAKEDFDKTKHLFSEVFHGGSAGKRADPRMMGSLLYHMAMVTKMESETRFLLEELSTDTPDIAENLGRFYSDFASDTHELAKIIMPLNVSPWEVATKASLSTDVKICMFTNSRALPRRIRKHD